MLALSTRRVLRLAGADLIHFLQAPTTKKLKRQGLTTNDLTPLSRGAPSAPSLYSAFLTPQGRIISDVFFHREEVDEERRDSGGRASTSTSPRSLFAEVDASVAPQVLSLLKRYRLRADVDIDDAGEDFEVVVEGYGGSPSSSSLPGDPRGVPQLGSRSVLPRGSSSYRSPSPASSYASARYALGVAEGSELEPGRGTPLEANLDGLRGVSFEKGCYVGQELVARAHFRGQVHKRIMPVEALGGSGSGGRGEGLIGKDLFVVDEGDGPTEAKGKAVRSAGRLLALCGESGRGLALVRLSSVFGSCAEERGGGEPVFPKLALAPPDDADGGEKTPLFSPSRPGWWPREWGCE